MVEIIFIKKRGINGNNSNVFKTKKFCEKCKN